MKRMMIIATLLLLTGMLCANVSSFSLKQAAADQNSKAMPRVLNPPQNLHATVDGDDVILNWDMPASHEGEWISWCNGALGNSIGTNAATSFDVAQRWTAADLAPYQGRYISHVIFVPGFQSCVYTLKIWTGGTGITNPGNLVLSQQINPEQLDDWNYVVLNDPILVPATGELRIGYNVNTTGGYPAGCDDGPAIVGKGNLLCFQNEWTTLNALAPSLTYNWLIKAYVSVDAGAQAPEILPHDPNRALLGYKVYRNSSLVSTINDPDQTSFVDWDMPNGVYQYDVTACYSNGESISAGVIVIVAVQLPPLLFGDGFEAYEDFALTFAPWTCIDVDMSDTYSLMSYDFPNAVVPKAFMIFNPSATVPPMTSVTTYEGNKMAACFAAVMGPNNDWLITPRLSLGEDSILRFYAKSHTVVYGMERIRVGVSTIPQIIPQGFQYISGTNYLEVPASWTEYSFNLSAYDNQQVYLAIRCVSDDAMVLYIDDFEVLSHGGGTSNDPFGNPVQMPGSMSVMANVLVNGVQAAEGDVLAAFVNVNGIPQLRGKQTLQLVNGVAGCILQIYTQTNNEPVIFKLWRHANNQVLNCITSLNTEVNGTVGHWPDNLFVINATSDHYQSLTLNSGWNLVSANVSPPDPSFETLCVGISPQLLQIKGTQGVYIPGNPFSTLQSLSIGKAYNVQMSAPRIWNLLGATIPPSTPLPLEDGWNLVAYLPPNTMHVSTALSSIGSWVLEVKGSDGVYIPGNPYSNLFYMHPGKGYWIKLNGGHILTYPQIREDIVQPEPTRDNDLVTRLPGSMVILARCDWAEAGDILVAKVGSEIRGMQEFIAPQGFAAALLQIYTDTEDEEISLYVQKPDGSLLQIAERFRSAPNATLGSYPEFIMLSPQTAVPEHNEPPTRLYGCYPNPFNPNTRISFYLAEDQTLVKISLYDLKGRLISRLANQVFPKGTHDIDFSASDLPGGSMGSGVYLIKMETPHYKKTSKMVLLK